MMRLMVRGWSGNALIFQEKVDTEFGEQFKAKAEEQLDRMSLYPNRTIELEFLDEPDVNKRFLRFGDNPSRMVMPFDLRTLLRMLKP